MPGPLKDADLLRDVEELAAIGLGYDRLVLMVRQRHEDRHFAIYCKQHGMRPDECRPEDFGWEPPKGASERTISRYLATIRERWAKEEEELRPARRQELRQKLQATFLKAYGEGGPSLGAAVRCLQVQAKIDGLEEPQKIEISGRVDVLAMSPFERQARIEELWALRQKALGVIDVKTKPARLPPASSAKKPAKKTTPKRKSAKATPKKAPARARKKTSK